MLLENLLRLEDGRTVTVDDIKAVAAWLKTRTSEREIAFRPARVLMQDFTGVPAVVDLAAMREAMAKLGGDPEKINPLSPVDLVIDHSVMVDSFGTAEAFARECQATSSSATASATRSCAGARPPSTISASCRRAPASATRSISNIWRRWCGPPRRAASTIAYPDTLVGTDSHTTMVNGLAVLGWGVGGIEAEAAMLGQPISMLIPEVVGFKLTGKLREGATATDLVLTVTQMLRKKGVVGKFVEFFGPGLASLALADRATIANMAPEYGATCGFFPIDAETLRYLALHRPRRRSRSRWSRPMPRRKACGATSSTPDPVFTDTLELDLGSGRAVARRAEPAAGPRAARGRRASPSPPSCRSSPASRDGRQARRAVKVAGSNYELKDGDVVIAAITSCTNTSNPSVMLAAGLLARNAVAARPQGEALGQDLAGARAARW